MRPTSEDSVKYTVNSNKLQKAKHTNAWPFLFIVTDTAIREQLLTRRTKITNGEYSNTIRAIKLKAEMGFFGNHRLSPLSGWR